MKILRWFLVFLVFALVMSGGAAWLQTPSGAKALSGWLTSRVRKSAPGTTIELENLKYHWPPMVTVEKAVWKDPAGGTLVTLKSIQASTNRLRFPPTKTSWKAKTQVRRLDLAGLDKIAGKGEWKSDGFLNGDLRFFGQGGRLQEIELDLQPEEPGGNLNSELLQRLVEMMPPDDTRAILLKALGAKATFHFNTGLLELRTEGEDVRLNLLLNGDHLLDLKIRISKESLKFLKETKLWK